AAGEVNVGIVAQQAEVGDVGPGRQMRRHVVGATNHALPGDGVHRGNVGGFQGRLAAERLLRFIRTAVGNNDCVFHTGKRQYQTPNIVLRPSKFKLLRFVSVSFYFKTLSRTLPGRVQSRRSISATAADAAPSSAICVMMTSGTTDPLPSWLGSR